MKNIKLFWSGLIALMIIVCSCEKDNLESEVPELENVPKYSVEYTEQQLKNWAETGSPFLDDELDNSSNTFIDPSLPSQAGLFKPMTSEMTRAWGVHPYQNRFWSMIRLKLQFTNSQWELKNKVIDAIQTIEDQTNIRFYNAINDFEVDPDYGIRYPNVCIAQATGAQIGSSYIGLKGGEQYIYLPSNATPAFIIRALVNVAGMYGEHQRENRDTYVKVYTANVAQQNRFHFDKITKNYYGLGTFDDQSITLAGTYEYSSSTSLKSIEMKNGATIIPKTQLSNMDRSFLNYFYLPYVARTDVYRELAPPVYNSNNVKLTDYEIQQLQAYLNNGNGYADPNGRKEKVDW
jgi:hypothetical protein